MFKKQVQKIIQYIKQLSLTSKIKWIGCIIFAIWFWFLLPTTLFNAPTSFVITEKEGNLLNAFIADDEQWRFPNNNIVPEKFVQCITTFEDKRFYYHFGIDPFAVGRAIKQNISNKKTVSGGSTITMQVIRLYKQHRKRNFFNKISEMLLALRLECSYKKKTILALYASNAPFGSNVVGLDAAAWRYFGRNATQLSWGEMAALAVLPNAPSLVHPGKNKIILLRKRNDLLDKLYLNKTIDQTTCSLAKLEPLPNEPKALPQNAPHLLDRFKKEFNTLKKENQLQSTAVQTTIDGNLQIQVNSILSLHHQQLNGNQIKNVAAAVIEVETGNILSYVGNIYNPTDAKLDSHVDILASKRSPGSTLKPLLYASLLTEGTILPKQLIPDIPTQIGGYTPQNFDLDYDGAVPANRALARSLNIPAVKMLQQFKYQKWYDVLKQCGFTSLHKPADFYGMSLILGGCEINPLELIGVYASMARMYNHQQKNKGLWNEKDWRKPNYLFTNNIGLIEHKAMNALFDYTAMWHTFNAMNEVMRPGEEGLWNSFSSAQRIAWKTGTSFGFRDGWSVGITPKYAVLVWVGNATGEGRSDLIGIKTAAPIMFDIFRLLPTSNWFNPPSSGFTYLPVCHYSGFKATNDCKVVDTILVSESGKNAGNCPYCKKINLDKTSCFRVNETCESPNNMIHSSWFILPPTIEYYYKQKHTEYKELPPFKNNCVIDAARVLDIIYPDDAAKIYIPIELSGEKGRTIFTATHKNTNATLFWHLDNHYIGTTTHLHQLALNPIIGKHIITVVDENGNTISRNFEVLQKQH